MPPSPPPHASAGAATIARVLGQLRSPAGVVLMARVAAFAFAGVLSVLVARLLLPQERGTWAVALMLTSLLALAAEGGLGISALYLMRQGAPREAVTTMVLGVGFSTSVALAGLGYFVLSAGVFQSWFALPPKATGLAVGASVMAVVISLARQLQIGSGDLRSYAASLVTQAALTLVAISTVLLHRAEATVGLSAYLVVLIATAAGGLARLRRLGWSPRWAAGLLRPLCAYGGRAQLSTLVLFLVYRFDLLLVGHFRGLAAAGVYSVALTLSEVLRAVPESAQSVVMAATHTGTLELRCQRVARLSLLATLVGGSIMAAAGQWLVPALFGTAYTEAARAFAFLVPGIAALALSYSLSPLLALAGEVEVSTVAAVIALAAMAALDWSWIPAFGLSGAAAASSIAYALLAAVQIAALRRRGRLRLRDLIPRRADLVRPSGAPLALDGLPLGPR